MLPFFQGFGVAADQMAKTIPFVFEGQEYTLKHGAIVISAITSCTNTSNPSVMLGAGMCYKDEINQFINVIYMYLLIWTL